MVRRLPNLNQIRAFEAAARHLSFKDAADELHVTHAAVSHQIKALEEMLGQKLFTRLTRQVRLTEAGQSCLPHLTEALDKIAQATSDVSVQKMQGTVKLSIAPFYGNRMILPRLGGFHALYPDLRIQPDMSSSLVDFKSTDVDASIRYGGGSWSGLTAILLHTDRSAPCAAPAYIAEYSLPVTPEDLCELTLAATAGREDEWNIWFTAVGHTPARPPVLVPYENRARALDLALSGHGVCLADLTLLHDDLASGQLVQLHPHAEPQDVGMYLVFPKTDQPDPRVLAFADWFKGELNV
jgi:LysR family glycine cleavage system transcriptional activator